ncbi:MAG TPA: hypothetical protein VK550_22630 [Polyangiaceae bacterium]|nr:hypothetical protein [Polyangiaceae bacterium]
MRASSPLGEGIWWTVDDSIAIMWSADLLETWLLPLRPDRRTATESDGARLVAKKFESSDQNPKSQFSLIV